MICADKINKGVLFLHSQQQNDGSFLSLTTTKLNDFDKGITSHAIVPSNIVLSCLNLIDETSTIKKIKQKTATFLLTQKSENWSFNYWVRGSKEAKATPYPDDLDDTFCALTALYQYKPDLMKGSVLAKIINLLTAVEVEEGGPYNMWLVPPDAEKGWKRTDLVVNSNIAYFLSLHDISLPKINSFIEHEIKIKNYVFPYCSIYPAIYFISRFYKGKKTKQIVDLLLSKREADGRWENPLYTALAISSLVNLSKWKINVELKDSIEYLISQQSKNGGWDSYPFYVELQTKEKTYYAGSAALTTALCLEAIASFDRHTAAKPKLMKKDEKKQKIYKQVIKRAEQRFFQLPVDLQPMAMELLEKTIKGDKDKQIVLIPYYFNLTLGKQGKKTNRDFLITLGLANIYGWIAYRIYDDFLDEEGKPIQLSLANVCLRELTAIYNNILLEKFREVMDILDNANVWEITHSRFDPKHFPPNDIPDFKDYSQLANKSFGHALGPIAILTKLGYKANSPEMENFIVFFRHYIIARQLNDDAHDWEEDLTRGQINAVGAKILRKTKVKSKLQEVFWQEVFEDVAATILTHVDQARSALPALESLLIPIEQSIQKGLAERKESIAFLKTYSK